MNRKEICLIQLTWYAYDLRLRRFGMDWLPYLGCLGMYLTALGMSLGCLGMHLTALGMLWDLGYRQIRHFGVYFISLSGMFRHAFDCPWYESGMFRYVFRILRYVFDRPTYESGMSCYVFDYPWYALKIRLKANRKFRYILDSPVWDVSACTWLPLVWVWDVFLCIWDVSVSIWLPLV